MILLCIVGSKLTDEEGNHLRGRDTLVFWNTVVKAGEAGPDGCDHDLDHVAAVYGLDGEPEHR